MQGPSAPCLFGDKCQYLIAFPGKRQVNARRDAGHSRFQPFLYRRFQFDNALFIARHPTHQRTGLPQDAQEEVSRFDKGRSELRGFVSRKEYGAPGLQGITFEHATSLQQRPER